MLLVLPALIAETGLLSFISRSHLKVPWTGAPLKEIPLKQATMNGRLVVTYRGNSHVPPAARRLIALLSTQDPSAT